MNIDDTAEKPQQRKKNPTASRQTSIASSKKRPQQDRSKPDASGAVTKPAQAKRRSQTASTQQSTDAASPWMWWASNQHVPGRWRPSKADVAMILAGLVPSSAYGPDIIRREPSFLYDYLVREHKHLIPAWFWEEKAREDKNEELIEAGIVSGPPYRAAYPGMSSDRIEAYLLTRVDPEPVSEEEAHRRLGEAYQVLEDIAELKDEAIKQRTTFAKVAPPAPWVEALVTKMKESIVRIDFCPDQTHLNHHVRMVCQHALCALYEGKMEVLVPFSVGDMYARRSRADAARYLAQAYKDLESMAKIKDKAVYRRWTFERAAPSPQWLRTQWLKSRDAHEEFKGKPETQGKRTHFETLVEMMTEKAYDTFAGVVYRARDFRPLSPTSQAIWDARELTPPKDDW